MDTPTLTPAAKTTLLACSLALWMMSGCAYMDPEDPKSPIANPEMSGKRQAHIDLHANQIQLMEAGKPGVDPEEVAPNDPRFRFIPRKQLPSGPGEPHAAAWVKYARAYNKVVMKHFDRETSQ